MYSAAASVQFVQPAEMNIIVVVVVGPSRYRIKSGQIMRVSDTATGNFAVSVSRRGL